MLDRPKRRCIQPRVIARVCLFVLLTGTILAASALAAKKSYRYEDDPVRLGLKAVEEGRFDDARTYFNEAIVNEHQVYRAHYGMAEIELASANFVDAEPLYRQALTEKLKETENAEFPEAHVGLGFTLMRLQRWPEAKQEFEQALKEKGNYWEAQYGLARVAIEDQKWDEAEKLLQKGEKKKGMKDREDLYRYGIARVELARGDLSSAEKNALTAFVLNPNDPDYGPLVGEIYDKRGARSLAREAYEKALSTPGVHVTARIYRDLGVLYQKDQMWNEALEKYRLAYQTDSTYAPAVRDMADLYRLADRNEEAMAAYLRYSQLRPDDPHGFLGFAQAAVDQKRYLGEAYDAAKKGFGLDSTNVVARLTLARAAFLNRKQAEASAHYSAVTDTTRFEAMDYVRIGQLALDQKDFDRAERNLEKAVEADSTIAEAYFALGLLDLQRQMPDSALAHYDRAVRIDPSNAGAWLNKGIAHMQLKQNAAARSALIEAKGIAPEYLQIRTYLASVYVAMDSLPQAVREYKKAVEIDPKNGMALRGLGFCYLKQRSYGTAATVLRDATAADPNNADGWVVLGQAEALQGNTAVAISAFEKALALKPDHPNAKAGLEALKKVKQGSAGN